MEKIYHIYAKDKCISHSVKEEDFDKVWKEIKGMIGLMKTDYSVEDLSYEEVVINKEVILNSSH